VPVNIWSLDLSDFFDAVSVFRAEFARLTLLNACEEEEKDFVSAIFPPLTPSPINIAAKWFPSSSPSKSFDNEADAAPSAESLSSATIGSEIEDQQLLGRIIRPLQRFHFHSEAQPIKPIERRLSSPGIRLRGSSAKRLVNPPRFPTPCYQIFREAFMFKRHPFSESLPISVQSSA
jgi:hypothetical protein